MLAVGAPQDCNIGSIIFRISLLLNAERFRIKYGMTLFNNNTAFTLIELLVVVLIIGILAAVAVPQYQKAVWKSRYVQLMAVGNAIASAETIHYLANGTYTDDVEALDISHNLTTNQYECWLGTAYEEIVCQFKGVGSNVFGYHIYFGRRQKRYCYVKRGDDTSIYAQICKNLTGHSGTDGENGSDRRGFLF